MLLYHIFLECLLKKIDVMQTCNNASFKLNCKKTNSVGKYC